MARVSFTANLQRHLSCPAQIVPGDTVRAVLDCVFAVQPRLRSYILDDQDRVRRHVAIYINGDRITDPERLIPTALKIDASAPVHLIEKT